MASDDETRTARGGSDPRTPGPSALPPPLAPGARVGDYRLDTLCGTGGFGTVYRATSGDGEVVALKVLHHYLTREERTVARFRREAEAVNRVAHPGVVRIRDVGDADDGRIYIAMDWVDGHTLSEQLAAGPLTLAETRAIALPLCDALAAAHAAGVVHRDVKASNVILTPDGAELRVTLLDFGIAKLLEPETGTPMSFTSTGDTVGSPHAMAPEQFRGGPVDARTDVYSVGVLLFQMLAGALPFSADNAADLRALHLEAPPPLLSDRAAVPAAIDALVARCLAKDPADRFDRIGEVAAALTSPDRPATDRGEVEAIAAYVAVDAEDDDRTDELLDEASRTLEGLGFEIAAELPSGLVAVAQAPAETGAAARLRHTILEHARELTTRTGARTSVVLHSGSARRDGATWTGPLLDLRGWAADPQPGITTTEAFRKRTSNQ